jgi:hypothetical protein
LAALPSAARWRRNDLISGWKILASIGLGCRERVSGAVTVFLFSRVAPPRIALSPDAMNRHGRQAQHGKNHHDCPARSPHQQPIGLSI